MTLVPSTLQSGGASAPADALGLPPVNQATLPADVRNGTAKQKQAYEAALQFENVLLQQLTQAMASTATDGSDSSSSSGGSSSGSSDGSSSSSDGSDAVTHMYQQMLPEQLAQALTSSGGVGIADQIYRAMEAQSGTPAGAKPSSGGGPGSVAGNASGSAA